MDWHIGSYQAVGLSWFALVSSVFRHRQVGLASKLILDAFMLPFGLNFGSQNCNKVTPKLIKDEACFLTSV